MATPWGFSVTVETLDRAKRRKRLTERPQERVHLERKATSYLDIPIKRTCQYEWLCDFV